MRKIAIFIFSRANYGRLKPIIDELQGKCELQLILGASFYDAKIPYPVASRIQGLVSGDDKSAMVLTVSTLLSQVTLELQRLKPDIALIHGDRYELLACAIATSYLGIKLAHTEGGEDTGCIDNKVRNAITALADIHFPVTALASLKVGLVTGFHEKHYGSPALDQLVSMDLTTDRKKPFVLVLYHPNTSKDEDINIFIDAVKTIKTNIVWVNPNVDAGSKRILKEVHKLDVEFVKDLPPEEYYKLLANCEYAIGNSSSFIKEGAFLGTPCVLVGDRQHRREVGSNVIRCALDLKDLLNAIDKIKDFEVGVDYKFGNGNSAKKIAEVLAC